MDGHLQDIVAEEQIEAVLVLHARTWGDPLRNPPCERTETCTFHVNSSVQHLGQGVHHFVSDYESTALVKHSVSERNLVLEQDIIPGNIQEGFGCGIMNRFDHLVN